MKNCFITLAMLVVLPHAFSQNLDQVQLSKQNKALLEELKVQEQSRIARVQSFLSLNPTVKATFKDGIHRSHIYDIIQGNKNHSSASWWKFRTQFRW
jgi:hypothetical protein